MKKLGNCIIAFTATTLLVTAFAEQISIPPRADIPDAIVSCDLGLLGYEGQLICVRAVKELTENGVKLTAESVSKRMEQIKQRK